MAKKISKKLNTYSIASSSEIDCLNFVKIVKPYIEQVPSLLYKIRDNFTKKEFLDQQIVDSEVRDSWNKYVLFNTREDIVSLYMKI